MIFRYAAAALALAATASKCAAFSTSLSNNHVATKPSTSSLSMGPPIDPSAPAVDLYGEGSRKYRRTVYTHDQWVKHRSSDRFVNNLSTLLNSGTYKNVGKEVFATTMIAILVWTWNMLVGGFEDFSGVMHDPLIQSNFATAIGLPLTIFTTLSPSLGLLLVFRTNSSYNRWDEARKFWGLNINHTRDLNRLATAWYGNDSSPGSLPAPKETKRVIDPEERAYLLGQVSLFTWAFVRSMKRHLSPPEEDEEDYVAELKTSRLTDEQANAIISAAHRPNRALYDLSVAIEKLPMHFMRKNEINKNLSIFEDTLGGSERLLSSPVPLFYSRHTARFISVWLLFLPFAMYGQFGESWNHIMMIPATLLISLFLCGIEELATQLEEPFTILPMQGFCDKIGMNCEEIVSWAGQDVYKMPEEVTKQAIVVDIEEESSVVDEPLSEIISQEIEMHSDEESVEEVSLTEEDSDLKMESDVTEVSTVSLRDLLDVKDEQTEIEMESNNEPEVEIEDETPEQVESPELRADSVIEETPPPVNEEVTAEEESPFEPPELKMEQDFKETVDVEDEQTEIEMASDNEPEVEIEDETPVQVESPELRADSVIDETPPPVYEEVTAEEESPFEPPEVKMEQDFKETDSSSTMSLRDLVDVKDEQTEIEMAPNNEPELEIEDETPAQVESPQLQADSVIEETPPPVYEEVTAEEESPVAPPEVKMEQDFKKTNNFSTVSLRDLVERL